MIRILVLAVLLVPLAGCGGDDKKESSNKTLSYSEFGEAANKVCNDQDKEIDPISDRLTGEAANDGPIYDELVPKLEDAAAEFEALKPPDELQADFDRVNSLIDQQVAAAKEAQAAAQSGDQAAYEKVIAKLQPLSEQTKEAESKLGAADCVKND